MKDGRLEAPVWAVERRPARDRLVGGERPGSDGGDSQHSWDSTAPRAVGRHDPQGAVVDACGRRGVAR